MKKSIRVLICDDQIVVCEGFKAILSTVKDIEVVVWRMMVKRQSK